MISLHPATRPLTIEGAIVWVAPPEARTPGGRIRHGLRLTALDWRNSLALALILAESP